MLIIDAVPGTSPVRHLVFVRHGAKNSAGNLTTEGHTQAKAVGMILQALNLGPFGKVVYSIEDRTADTAESIMSILDPKCEVSTKRNDYLVDHRAHHKPELVKVRQALYKRLGEVPLAQFRQDDTSAKAMDELGIYIRTSIEHDLLSCQLEGNYLVVGHGVYLNQGLMNLLGHKMTQKMFDEILHGPCLDVATGYLIGVDEKLVPTQMLRFSWQEANLD